MRRLGLSFAQLAASTIAGQVIGFAVLVAVARKIGPTNLGAYAFASSVIPYIILPLSGLVMLTVRDIAQNRPDASRLAGAILPILVSYITCACAVVFFIAPHIAPTPLSANMVRILTVSAIVSTLTLDWILQGLQALNVVALMRLVGQIAFGIAAFFLITTGEQGAYRYAWLNIFGLAVTLIGISVFVVRISGWPVVQLSLRKSLLLIRRGGAFTVSLVMIQLYYSADFILLGFLSDSAAVGQYLAAYKLPLAFLGLASLWVTVFYPHAATQERTHLRRQIGIFTTLTLILVIPLCAGSFILATPLMTALFGAQYAPAGPYFELLMLAVGFAAVDANISQVLLATGHERAFAYGVTLGAAANIGLNFLLIPSHGPEGSAIATIAAEAIVLVVVLTRLRTTIGLPTLVWPRIVGAAVSTLVMVIVLSLVADHWSVFAQLATGVAVYLVSALLTRTVRRSDYGLFSQAAASS